MIVLKIWVLLEHYDLQEVEPKEWLAVADNSAGKFVIEYSTAAEVADLARELCLELQSSLSYCIRSERWCSDHRNY